MSTPEAEFVVQALVKAAKAIERHRIVLDLKKRATEKREEAEALPRNIHAKYVQLMQEATLLETEAVRIDREGL